MNEELIDNSPEAKLKRLVSSYKKYDAKRKKYYENKLKELGKLQSFIQEIEDANGFKNLPNFISNIQTENKSLRKRINDLSKELDCVRLLLTPEILHLYRTSKSDRELWSKISSLEKDLDTYKAKLKKSEELASDYLKKLIKLQQNEKF